MKKCGKWIDLLGQCRLNYEKILKVKEKILILGGNGFIGLHLIKKLRNLGFECFSLSLKKVHEKNKKNNIHYLNADISDFSELSKVVGQKKYDYIVNLSGYIDITDDNVVSVDPKGCLDIDDAFSYKCIETKMKGGAKIIRKVTIKGKKGYKSVTTKKKNKKAKTVRKSLNPKQVEMVKKGKR